MSLRLPIGELSIAEQIEREEVEIRAALAVQALTGDEHVARVLDGMDREWTEAWRATKPSQSAEREELYRRLLILGEFRERLAQIVETGKLAKSSRDVREAQRLAQENTQ